MSLKLSVLLLAVLLQICFVTSNSKFDVDGPIVEIPNGKVQGTYQKFKDSPYMQFHGIPYAKPPTGKRRFKLSKPITRWEGTWIANKTYMCLQVDHYDTPQEGLTTGDEDCLYVNVFVPGNQINTDANLDVIVHIHGGGFMFGSSNGYSKPKPFMNKNVVFVTLNYRLGIFGFMSLEDQVLPGNLGMKDQNLALKWVRDNIIYFGGNPNSITITGLSAGGASVHYHLLSPMSKGLFQRAISVSGNTLDPWTIHEAPRQKAILVGKALGCQYLESKEFLDCLRSRPASQIVEVTKLFRQWIYLPYSPFGLVVDSWAEEPFLPEHPLKLLQQGKVNDVPWIASLTSGEGLYPVAQLAARQEYFEELNKNYEKHLPPLLHYESSVIESDMKDVTNKIKKEYLGDKAFSKETYTQIIKMASDRLFNLGMEQSIRLHTKAIKSPVFFYYYDYTAENIWSFANFLFPYKEKYGVSHGDDIMMMFDAPMKPTKRDAAMTEFLQNLWVQFAKTGKVPRPDWTPLFAKSKDSLDYLFIGGPETIEMRSTNDLGNKAFWNSLPIIELEKLFKTKQYKNAKHEL